MITSIDNFVELTLKPLHPSSNQSGSKNIIVVLVPRSQIDDHRTQHQVGEGVGDELLAQALAEEHLRALLEDGPNAGVSSLVDRSRFLFERPQTIEDRLPDYDHNGFKAWIL